MDKNKEKIEKAKGMIKGLIKINEEWEELTNDLLRDYKNLLQTTKIIAVVSLLQWILIIILTIKK